MKNINDKIDCRGLNCPIPVVNTKRYFDRIDSGSGITIVDNEVAKNNVIKFSEGNGFKYEVDKKADDLFYISILKGEEIENNSCAKNMTITKEMPLTIVIGSDKLGDGDAELGTALMKSYLFALSEANIIPVNLLFLNGGVKLVVEDSLTLDSIKKLKERGVNIQSCGLCLDFYELKTKLAVGEITNMYAIIEMMNSGNTIKL